MLRYFLVVDSVEFDKCAKWQRLSYSTLHRISKRLCDVRTTLHGIALMPHLTHVVGPFTAGAEGYVGPTTWVNATCTKYQCELVMSTWMQLNSLQKSILGAHTSVCSIWSLNLNLWSIIRTTYVSVLHSFIKILPSLLHYLITAIKIVETTKYSCY